MRNDKSENTKKNQGKKSQETLAKDGQIKQDSWLEEIIVSQSDDLFEEDTLLDKIPKNLSEKYRDEQ